MSASSSPLVSSDGGSPVLCGTVVETTTPPATTLEGAEEGAEGGLEEELFESPVATLIQGYQRFRQTSYLRHEETYRTLGRNGQTPPVLVIACADSRCDPSVIFDSPPGELFVIRNVANLVPPYKPDGNLHGVSAALEFAVKCLKVRQVVIMGHGKCGGVCACLLQASNKPSKILDDAAEFLAPWVSMLSPARDRVLKSGTVNPQYALELEGIELSINNLMTFPFVKTAVDNDTLRIDGAWFAIEHGELHWRNPSNRRFEIVPTETVLDSSNPNEKEMSRSNSANNVQELEKMKLDEEILRDERKEV